jgi:Tfp pilus assembly protein PilN
MPNINLLPWREELREELKRAFFYNRRALCLSRTRFFVICLAGNAIGS